MEPGEIITLVIAIWGAVLSTFLAGHEILKESRNIKITLLNVIWFERHKILITNAGHRPITIIEIGLRIKNKVKGYEPIPSGAFFATEEGFLPPSLPLILTDGQVVEFHLSRQISNELSNKDNSLFIFIYDSEGNVYEKYRHVIHDPKYAEYYKK